MSNPQDEYLEDLRSALLTPLAKPAGGVRPIACGEFLRRLTSKVAAKALLKKVRPALFNQFGVGSANGIERVVHEARRVVESRLKNPYSYGDPEKDFVICKVDLKNAFRSPLLIGTNKPLPIGTISLRTMGSGIKAQVLATASPVGKTLFIQAYACNSTFLRVRTRGLNTDLACIHLN